MIKSINNIEQIEVTIIPKLKGFNEVTLCPGDTLVAFVDHNKWCIKDAKEFYNLLQKSFPENNICIMYDGIELGVIHEERSKKRD